MAECFWTDRVNCVETGCTSSADEIAVSFYCSIEGGAWIYGEGVPAPDLPVLEWMHVRSLKVWYGMNSGETRNTCDLMWVLPYGPPSEVEEFMHAYWGSPDETRNAPSGSPWVLDTGYPFPENALECDYNDNSALGHLVRGAGASWPGPYGSGYGIAVFEGDSPDGPIRAIAANFGCF